MGEKRECLRLATMAATATKKSVRLWCGVLCGVSMLSKNPGPTLSRCVPTQPDRLKLSSRDPGVAATRTHASKQASKQQGFKGWTRFGGRANRIRRANEVGVVGRREKGRHDRDALGQDGMSIIIRLWRYSNLGGQSARRIHAVSSGGGMFAGHTAMDRRSGESCSSVLTRVSTQA